MTDTAQRLTALPSLYRQLVTSVTEVRDTVGSSSNGRPLPFETTAYDFLHHPHPSGHFGLIDGLSTLDLITRAQLGHSAQEFYGRDLDGAAVESACMYLGAQLPIIETTEAWTTEASRLVEDALDQTLSHIDSMSIRVEFDGQVRAAKRNIDTENFMSDSDLPALMRTALMDYVDFEGEWYDRIATRYLAACSAFGWVAFVKNELRWLHRQATIILGIVLPSPVPLSDCPFCEDSGCVWLHVEHDSAVETGQCDACRRSFTPEELTMLVGAGWKPQRISA